MSRFAHSCKIAIFVRLQKIARVARFAVFLTHVIFASFARLTKFEAQICYCYDHFVQVSKTAVKIIYIPTFTHLRLKTSEAVKIIH